MDCYWYYKYWSNPNQCISITFWQVVVWMANSALYCSETLQQLGDTVQLIQDRSVTPSVKCQPRSDYLKQPRCSWCGFYSSSSVESMWRSNIAGTQLVGKTPRLLQAFFFQLIQADMAWVVFLCGAEEGPAADCSHGLCQGQGHRHRLPVRILAAVIGSQSQCDTLLPDS